MCRTSPDPTVAAARCRVIKSEQNGSLDQLRCIAAWLYVDSAWDMHSCIGKHMAAHYIDHVRTRHTHVKLQAGYDAQPTLQ